MYCKICGKRTTWDTSVGKTSFIVCNPCFDEWVEKKQGNIREVYSEIMRRGEAAEPQPRIATCGNIGGQMVRKMIEAYEGKRK